MNRVIDYHIIISLEALDLEDELKKYWAEGFVPVGGIAYHEAWDREGILVTTYVQAVVKYEADPR